MLESVPSIPERPKTRPQKSVKPADSPVEGSLATALQEVPIVPSRPNRESKETNDSVLNSQTQTSDDELDGDKTPGTTETKLTFKDEYEDEAQPDVSSFDDDTETILQEKDADIGEIVATSDDVEDTLVKESQPEPSILENTKDNEDIPKIPRRPVKLTTATPVLSRASTGNVSNQADDHASLSAEPLVIKETEEVVETKAEEPIAEAIEANEPEETPAEDPVIEAHPAEEVSPADPVIEQTASDTREVLAEEVTEPKVEETKEDAIAGSPSSPIAVPEPETSKREPELETNKPEPEAAELEKPATPVIPVRPARPQMPILPKRPSKKEVDTVSGSKDPDATPSVPSRPKKVESDTEKKGPPPKPKKLSSKIAAFQQMFNQAPVEKPTPKEPPRGKLSSEKTNFAANLHNIMGRGIAMPGMVSPEMLKAPEKEEEEVEPTAAPSAPRRAKGPRGKRLPKLIQDTTVTVESRFKLTVSQLWEINFEKEPEEDPKAEAKLEELGSVADAEPDYEVIDKPQEDVPESSEKAINSDSEEEKFVDVSESSPLTKHSELATETKESNATATEVTAPEAEESAEVEATEVDEAEPTTETGVAETEEELAPSLESKSETVETAEDDVKLKTIEVDDDVKHVAEAASSEHETTSEVATEAVSSEEAKVGTNESEA